LESVVNKKVRTLVVITLNKVITFRIKQNITAN
jgi:hypothetical protein